jgi:hypothetical protein
MLNTNFSWTRNSFKNINVKIRTIVSCSKFTTKNYNSMLTLIKFNVKKKSLGKQKIAQILELDVIEKRDVLGFKVMIESKVGLTTIADLEV